MKSCRRALVSSSSADSGSADSVALTWAGVALGALLLCGCTRAGFSVSGEAGPADGAVEAARPDQGAVDRGVTEAAAPDMRPGCPKAPAHAWSRGIGAAGKDYAVGVAVDKSGNVYLTGMFSGSADFGDGKPLSSADGSGDIFVASYTAKGAHRWSKRFGDTGEDGGDDVWIDASGNVYVAGSFSGGVDFGGGERSSEMQSVDAFVASFTSAGDYRWSRHLGGASTDSGSGVATDGSGNVYFIGSFRGSMELGGKVVASKGLSDTFIVSYTGQGVHRWNKQIGGSGEDYGSAIAVDPSGNVTATGRFFSSVDLAGTTVNSKGQDDIYLVSYTSAGSVRWRQAAGGAGEDVPFDVVADSSGDVFVTGRFQQSVDFGKGPVSSNGLNDIFVASFTKNGAPRWSQGFGGVKNDAGRRLALDGAGNVLLSAVYEGTANPGGGALTSKGGGDMLAVSYAGATGKVCWQRSFGDASDDAGYGVAAGAGQVVLAGWFYDALDLGGTTLSSKGGMDAFVAGFAP